jgi:hypothetical protein
MIMKTRNYMGLGVLVAGLMMSTVATMAQGAGGRGGGGGGNFDPEQMRARMAERMKEQMRATDEEWKVIQPLLEDVQAKQRDVAMGRMGGMMGRAGGAQAGGPGAGRPGADARGGMRAGGPSPEVEALGKTLEVENPPASELRARLAAVREARKKAEAELDQAQEKLRQVLTLRQEAQCVMMGLLK